MVILLTFKATQQNAKPMTKVYKIITNNNKPKPEHICITRSRTQ